MKFVKESIFLNTIRSFFVALFGTVGAILGVGIAVILIILMIASTDDKKKSFSSNVKILPDAQGNRKELASSTPVMLEIAIEGIIGCDPLTSEKIEEVLLDSREEAFKNGRVKAILLAINSPGGGAIESDTIYRLIKAYKQRYEIPIYAYVNGLCASGGYYIACAADKIFASPTSLIGSIGVVSWPPYLNIVGAMEKLGISALTLSAGEGKDTLNPTRPWKPNEAEHRQELIDFLYKDFVKVVTDNRPQISENDLVKVYGAEVFPTPDAIDKGYIDQMVDLKADAIKALAEQAGISDSYQVVRFKTKTWWKQALSEQSTLPAIKHELSFPMQQMLEAPCRFQHS